MKRLVAASLLTIAATTASATGLASPAAALSDRFQDAREQMLNKLNDRFDSERQQTLDSKLIDRSENERRQSLNKLSDRFEKARRNNLNN